MGCNKNIFFYLVGLADEIEDTAQIAQLYLSLLKDVNRCVMVVLINFGQLQFWKIVHFSDVATLLQFGIFCWLEVLEIRVHEMELWAFCNVRCYLFISILGLTCCDAIVDYFVFLGLGEGLVGVIVVAGVEGEGLGLLWYAATCVTHFFIIRFRIFFLVV